MKKIKVLYNTESFKDYLKPLEEFLSKWQVEFEFCQKSKCLLDSFEASFLIYEYESDKIWDVDSSLVGQTEYVCCYNRMLFEREQENELTLHCIDDDKMIGIVDWGQPLELTIPQWRGVFKYLVFKENNHELLSLGQNLNKVMSHSLNELLRIKKLHERLVPIRKDKLKGATFFGKYAAGESSGGDFFDVIFTETEALSVVTSSKSYVVSSVILTHFEQLRQSKKFDRASLVSFITNLSNELKSLELEKNVDFLMMHLDLRSMGASFYHFGEGEVVSSSQGPLMTGNKYPLDPAWFDQATVEIDLDRGEKIALLSSGIRRNCGGLIDGKDLHTQFIQYMKKDARDFVDEVFFQLKKDSEKDFLAHDASLIYVEVDYNAIIQV